MIGIVQYGLGPIGISVLKLLLEKKGLEIVGAIDIDPEKIGKSLSDVTGEKDVPRIKVTNHIEDVRIENEIKVAIHATGSYIEDVFPQLKEISKQGFHIVSSCEELSYPWKEHPEIAYEIDRIAKDNEISILGTGVNPGFLMDALPIVLTGVCQRISRIECKRVQDASSRRLPFQKKIGAGLGLDDFQNKVNSGMIRHVGFRESLHMISDAMNWKLDKIVERVEPILAKKEVKSEFLLVEKGKVAGINQMAIGLKSGSELLKLNLQAYLGCKSPREEIRIEGLPNIEMEIKGGVHGDIATASILVNSISKIVNTKPGLHTMRDLAIPSALLGGIREPLGIT